MLRDVRAGADRDQHDAQVVGPYDRARRMAVVVGVLGLAVHLLDELCEVEGSSKFRGIGPWHVDRRMQDACAVGAGSSRAASTIMVALRDPPGKTVALVTLTLDGLILAVAESSQYHLVEELAERLPRDGMVELPELTAQLRAEVQRG